MKDPKDSGNEAGDEDRKGGNEVVNAVQELGDDQNVAHVDRMVQERILNRATPDRSNAQIGNADADAFIKAVSDHRSEMRSQISGISAQDRQFKHVSNNFVHRPTGQFGNRIGNQEE